MNGFEMKWVYELVARSQEARSSDCFVNSDSLKFRLISKGMCLLCLVPISFLFKFLFRGVVLGPPPHYLTCFNILIFIESSIDRGVSFTGPAISKPSFKTML